jgi:P27 family predicted phage terminase small subunit
MARPRKPRALLESSGAFVKNPKRARERGEEPQFRRGAGEPPAYLQGFARDAWIRLSEHLDSVDLMRQPYADALAGACSALALAISADATLRATGLLVEQGSAIRLNPAYSASLRSWNAFRQFCAEFGLSPKAAAQLAAPDAKPLSLEDVLSTPAKLPNLDHLKIS